MSLQVAGESRPEQLQPADELLEAFRRTRSPADFERVVRRFAPLVIGECRRVTRDAHDAEDAAQLAFLALAIELAGGGSIRRPGAWLQRVAKRQALKIVRSRGRRRRREHAARREDLALPEPARMEVVEQERHAALVRDAIDALPETYRLPIVLHYFGGLSLDAISREMRITRQTVGVRLHRGRKLLATTLAARGVTLADGALTGIAATLVPAAVVAALLRAGAPATVVTAAPGAGFAGGVAALVNAANAAAGRRAVVAAALALGVTAASGFGWAPPAAAWLRAAAARVVAPGWLHDLVDLHPGPLPAAPRMPSPPLPLSSTIRPATSLHPLPAPAAVASAPNASRASQPGSNVVAATEAATPIRAPAAAPPAGHIDYLSDAVAASIGSATPADGALPTLSIGSRAGERRVIADGETLRARELRVGEAAGDRGSLLQNGGRIDAGRLMVGDGGDGLLDLRGGVAGFGGLVIGAMPRSHGVVRVAGGELRATDDGEPIVVGGLGNGKLLLGTQDEPGRFTTLGRGADASLVVRATEQAGGLIQGWGDVRIGGTLTNNGRVVADGFDHLRTLDFGQVRAVANTIDNPRDGTSGWFARRGGRVALPETAVRAGTGTYTWGEDDADPTLDLINSLRLTVHDQPTATRAAISLRTIAGADPLDVPLPTDVAILSLWQISAAGLAPASLDVTTRYDQTSASAIWPGEAAVRLLGHVDGNWVEADGQSVDRFDRLLSGTFGGAPDLLAVGIFWDDPFRLGNAGDLGTLRPQSLRGAGIVPEPGTLTTVALVATLARRRRPREPRSSASRCGGRE